jgi:hypothetical protein
MKAATQSKTQTELAGILDVSKAAISDAKRRNIIPSDWLVKLSRPPHRINPLWIETGQGVMRIPGIGAGNTNAGYQEANAERFHIVPVAALKVTMNCLGPGLRTDRSATLELDAEETRLPSYAFSQDWLARRGAPARLKLMRVSGDCMRPTLLDNDLVLVDESQREVREGKIYAIRIDSDVVLKRIAKKPGAVTLISDNRDLYDPLVVDLEHDANIEILGRVVWLARESL